MSVFERKTKENRPFFIDGYERLMLDQDLEERRRMRDTKLMEYLKSRSGDLDLSYLDKDIRSEVDRDETSAWTKQKELWYLIMPLPYGLCEKIYEWSAYMSKNEVMRLAFQYYELDKEEADFFDIIYSYGRAAGMAKVGKQLFLGATGGDPRAVKMYLDLQTAIDSAEGDGEDQMNKIRVSFDLESGKGAVKLIGSEA